MSLFDSGTDHDPSVLLPNRYSAALGVTVAQCPCGGTPSVRDGVLSDHFPPMHRGCAVKDPFLPGTVACRYSGRSVTVRAATGRDAQPTREESRVRGMVRTDPSCWLGLLRWIDLEDARSGDRIGFTQTERPDPFEPATVHERRGRVVRRGKTFVSVVCEEDGLEREVRLTAKGWKRARVRMAS